MTSTFQQLNPQIEPTLCIRQGRVYEIPVKFAAGAGFLCSVSAQGDGIRAELVSPLESGLAVVDLDKLVVGGPATQVLRLEGLEHGATGLVFRHARPWLGENDELAEEFRVEVQVSSKEVQQAWEDQIAVAPVSDEEVRRVLDILDGKKPYGGKKCEAVRQVLAIVAQDVAVHRHAGEPYGLAEWKVEGFTKVFPAGMLPQANRPNVRRALEQFIESRLA